MTPLQQRGYDDQRAGTLDAALMADDGARGREYRDGTRMRRRDAFDEAAHAPFQTKDEPPPKIGEHEVVTTVSQWGGGGFSTPQIIPPVYAKKKTARKAKEEDGGQGSLF